MLCLANRRTEGTCECHLWRLRRRHSHIMALMLQKSPHLRAYCNCCLREVIFDAERKSEAALKDGLQADQDAVGQRHRLDRAARLLR